MKWFKRLAVAAGLASMLAFVGCDESNDFVPEIAQAQQAGFQVFTGSGAANVQAAINAFQALIGGANNASTAGSQATGFRSINWDAGIVPVEPAAFPFDFFNNANTSPATRGLIVGAGGNQLRASNNAFANLNADYPNQFTPFSANNLFAATSSRILWARFEIPGATGVPAAVTGFGAVFSDVDNAGTTTVEYFNGNTSLGVFQVPTRSDANGHSFLGVVFTNGSKITSVKITQGDAAMGVTAAAGPNDVSNGGTQDIVVVDDFFYGEPRVVGTP